MGSNTVWEFASAFLISLGGASVLVAGLSGWLGHLWAKRILENEQFTRQKELESLKVELQKTVSIAENALTLAQEREKAELEHRVHVSKTQFDLEFTLYRDIWDKLTQLRSKNINFWIPLRDRLSAGTLLPEEITNAELLFKEIASASDEFFEFVVSRRPFVAEPIEEFLLSDQSIAFAIRGIAKRALEAARTNDITLLTELNSWQSAANAEQTQLARLIRERLLSVSVVA